MFATFRKADSCILMIYIFIPAI